MKVSHAFVSLVISHYDWLYTKPKIPRRIAAGNRSNCTEAMRGKNCTGDGKKTFADREESPKVSRGRDDGHCKAVVGF